MEQKKFNWDLFFYYLGDRIYNENRLSDITWAFCKSNTVFQYQFLSFLFGENDDFKQEIDLIREFTRWNDLDSKYSRPDFYFSLNDQEYIIEVKINDLNHHFEDYNATFSDAKKSYITNYFIEDKSSNSRENFTIKTWEAFYLHLQKINKPHFNAYCTYLAKVCRISKIETMDLSNLKSLTDFHKTIEKILDETNNISKGNTTFTEGNSGCSFILNTKEYKVNCWLGLVYHMKGIFVTIKKDNNFSDNFINQNFSNEESNLDNNQPWYQEGLFYFMTKEELFKQGFEKTEGTNISLENQVIFIQDFLNEVVDYINKYFNEKAKI